MKKASLLFKTMAAVFAAAITISVSSCSNQGGASSTTVDSLKTEIGKLTAGNDSIAKYLVKFDTLDFTVFSKQQWLRLHESHAKDILVHWPDGHTVKGIDQHIKDLEAMFVYAPDTKVIEHPIKFGSGKYTAVTGIMTATFTKPMPIGNGKFIQPTGKKCTLPMCTVGVWKDGVMVEEYLYWDNQSYMKQLGIM